MTLTKEVPNSSCYLIRKPDPPVQVAVTDPAKKGRPASVQVLDYNLRRFVLIEVRLFNPRTTHSTIFYQGLRLKTAKASKSSCYVLS